MNKNYILFLAMLLAVPGIGVCGLGNFYSNTKQGLNYVSASVNLNGRNGSMPGALQPAALAIAGIPAGSVIEAAYLYWVIESESVGTGNTVTIRNYSLCTRYAEAW